MIKISRQDAKAQGLKTYYTGKPCKHGHITKRTTSNGRCHACGVEHNRSWQAANPSYSKKASLSGERLQKMREYKKANPDRCNAHTAKRRAAKLQRTPAWADHELIALFYAEAQALTELTGIPHEVDHIVPLQGETVSGLHVATNLQVITAAANRSKGNAWR